MSLPTGGKKMQDIKDIQIKILTETIASLISENAELRACILVQNKTIKDAQDITREIKESIQEVTADGEHQDSSAYE